MSHNNNHKNNHKNSYPPKHIPTMPVLPSTEEREPIKQINENIMHTETHEPKVHKTTKEAVSLSVPIAIIIAGVFVAGSILYTGSKTPAVPKDAAYTNVASQMKKGTIAEEVGLNKKAFAKCLASGKHTAEIKAISDAGVTAGITGTPFGIIVTASGKKFLINGAEPIENVKAKIELALSGSTKDSVEIAIPPITEKDFVAGNRNAEIKIVEYSDTECPFSKRFHETMVAIMKDYEASGKVAWVYRYFPLDSLHQKARLEAEAVACAGELGGNTKFWEYLNLMFKITPANDGLDSTLL